MTSKEILTQLRVLLGMQEKPEDVKVEMVEITLPDGSIIQYDTLEVGSNILIKNTDGEFIPIPIGEYTLEDGTVISVEVEGIIAVITAPAENEPIDEEDDVPTYTLDTLAEEIMGINTRINEIETNLNSVMEILSTLVEFKKVNEETFSQLSSKVEEIAKLPSTTPIFNQQKHEDNSIDNRFQAIEDLKKFKNQ